MPGHSYMACDRAFGHIEKAVLARSDVYTFDEYRNIIESAVHEGYNVFPMKREEFLNFDGLQEHIIHCKPRQPYKFEEARKFVFTLSSEKGSLLL